MVSRTSGAARSASTFSPSASSAAQASSENGRVTRGVSETRATLISNENFVSAGSTVPVIGAAERKCGVAASGIWPSPANRPEVGSSPIQPAPGMNTSAQACRSAPSCVGPGGRRRHHVRLQLDQVARDETRRQPEMAQRLHQQPRAVAAGAGARFQRFLRRERAGLHAHHVAHGALHAIVQIDQELHGADRPARHVGQEGAQPRAERLGSR